MDHLINCFDFIFRFISRTHCDTTLEVHTCTQVRWTHSQVAQVSVRCETHLLKRLRKLDKTGKGVSHVIRHAYSRQHYDLNVVLEVHKNHKF